MKIDFQKLYKKKVAGKGTFNMLNGTVDFSPRPILQRLMIALSVMVAILALGTGILLLKQYQHYINDMTEIHIDEINSNYHVISDEQALGMATALQPIVANPAVKEALKERDSQRLLNDWRDVFARMKKENKITHFYFLDKNRVCLLRVHKPDKKGDIINRFTALKAEWQHKTVSGIEIGPLGTFTLRVVEPVFDKGELVGYVELGKEIEDILQTLHAKSGNEIAVVIRKEYLKRQAWEEGMKMLGRPADWNQLPDEAVIYTSSSHLYNVFGLMEEHHVQERLNGRDINHQIFNRGKEWRVSILPIQDVSGKEVGDMIIMNDISTERNEFFHFVLANALIGVVLTGLVIVFIFFLLRRTDRNIRMQQQNLHESEERFEQLNAHSRTFIWEVDATGLYTYVSNGVSIVLGYRPEELIGHKYFYDLHPHEGREAFKTAAFDTFKRHESFEHLQTPAVSSTGESVWLSTNAIAMVDSEGNLIGYRGSDTDVTRSKQAEEQIGVLAFSDQLTGLPNRRLLMDRLRQAIAGTSRSGSYGALLFIDLDNFKTLNDTLGHDTGDILLKEAARRISGCVREGDSVARFGGDEFVVILVGLSQIKTEAATAGETVGEKILTSLNSTYLLNGIGHRSSASIGVTLFQGDESSIDELMKQADLAMYKAKEAGRNGLSFFDPEMEFTLKERAKLEEDLRKGIDENQFLLYYQPQIMDECIVTGCEALIRWRHPQRGLVSPLEFIPVAEATGLILPLGQWILKSACDQLARWSDDPHTNRLMVAVNVSVRQFSQNDFVEQVLAIIETSGADPKRLKFELTESLLVHDFENVVEKMARLKAAGISFSLDDFGTGYSSLSYLKRLPLDQLKIDQSFVRDILIDTNDAILCRSTIALAESMGLRVIAEGVESAEQRNALAGMGCYAFQGYWFSRPLPIEEFETYVMTMSAKKEV